MRLLTLILLSLTFACDGSDPLAPGFHEELVDRGGCGDVVFYAVDPADRLMLSFRAEGLVAEARAAGEPTVTSFQLPHADAELILERGSRVSDVMCDDVVENDGPQVERTWTATAGSAVLTVRPALDQHTGSADLRLEDIVLESDGDRVTVDRLEWTDIPVGWYPG